LGEQVSEGDDVIVIEIEGAAASAPEAKEDASSRCRGLLNPRQLQLGGRMLLVIRKFLYLNIGGTTDVEVIEICVAEGEYG